jgi:hypothetical protein
VDGITVKFLEGVDEPFLPQDFDPEIERRDIDFYEMLAGKLDDQ